MSSDSTTYKIPGVLPALPDPMDTPAMFDTDAQITGVDEENKMQQHDNLQQQDDLIIDATEHTTPSPQINETQTPEANNIEFNTQSVPSTTDTEINAPALSPTVRRSAQVKTQTKSYQPTMKGKTYHYSNAQLEINKAKWDCRALETILTQLSLKAAMKAWGDDARAAAESEMKQLHWRNSF